MEKKVAGFIIAPIWHEIMQSVLLRKSGDSFTPPEQFPAPKPVLRGEWRGGREYIVDKISGKQATENTPLELQEKKVIPEVHSILYWINKNDPLGPIPINPSEDSQFTNWEYQVRIWATRNGFVDQNESIIPKTFDDIHTPDKTPRITHIQFNPAQSIFQKNETVILKPIIQSFFEIAQVDYFINDEYKGSIKRAPFELVLNLDQINIESNIISIRTILYDVFGNKSDYQTTIAVE